MMNVLQAAWPFIKLQHVLRLYVLLQVYKQDFDLTSTKATIVIVYNLLWMLLYWFHTNACCLQSCSDSEAELHTACTVCTVHKYSMSSWGWVLRHAPQENVGSEVANYDEYFDIQNSFSNIIHTHIESTFIISYNTMGSLM